MTRKIARAAAGAFAAALRPVRADAQPQKFPSRPIRVAAPFSAGREIDSVAWPAGGRAD
jgi:tripartite-type tricarboxylate transporter receptor subunit TctC